MCNKILDFEYVDGMGHHKGMFKKIHNGCVTECLTGADRYDITLPEDEVEAALILAAVQIMDMLYFENPWSCWWP